MCVFLYVGVEWVLAENGAVSTNLESDPRKEASRTKFTRVRRGGRFDDEEDDF